MNGMREETTELKARRLQIETTISIADAELRRRSAEVAQRITHRSRIAGRCIVAPFFWSNG